MRTRVQALFFAVCAVCLLAGCGGGGGGGGDNGNGSGEFDQPPPVPRITVATKLTGLDFGPYVKAGQDPNVGTNIPANQLAFLIKDASQYAGWIRTFGTTNGLEHAGQVAHANGMKAAIGAFLSADVAANQVQINNLIQAAQNGEVDLAIVGNEILLVQDTSHTGLTEDQLLGYISQVRQAIPASVPVTTVDTWNTLVKHPRVLAAVDVVLANIYPFYENKSIDQALATLQADYQQLKLAAGTKAVWIAETGWPSSGNPPSISPLSVPSAANQARYFQDAVTWSRTNGVPLFWFAAYDEPWKALHNDYPSFGILDSQTYQLKPGLEGVF